MEPFAVAAPGRMDDDLGAIGRGDGDATREALEPQRPARIEADRPIEMFGLIVVPEGGPRGDANEREHGDDDSGVSHGSFDEMNAQNVHGRCSIAPFLAIKSRQACDENWR